MVVGSPGSPSPAPLGVPPFLDVATTSFAFDDIGRIFRMGVTVGTGPTAFSPAAYVTREQMAAFLARLVRELARVLD